MIGNRTSSLPVSPAPPFDKTLRLLGPGLMGFALALIIATVGLTIRNGTDLFDQAFLISVAIAALVGGAITYYRPRHPIGWFILGFALCFALGEFSRQYVIYGAFRSLGTLPALPLVGGNSGLFCLVSRFDTGARFFAALLSGWTSAFARVASRCVDFCRRLGIGQSYRRSALHSLS